MEEMIITTQNAPAYANKTLQSATNRIFKIGETVRKCAFETAYIMAQVDATECYKDDGFNSVHEWAMKTFGFKKSASYSLLRVGKEYTRTISDAKGKIKGYGSNLIEENAENDFTTSQIEKMLPGGRDLAVELVEAQEITPDMTCKEIEKVIKAHTAPEPEEAEAEPEEAEAEPEEAEAEVATRIVALVNEDGTISDIRYKVPVDILEDCKI